MTEPSREPSGIDRLLTRHLDANDPGIPELPVRPTLRVAVVTCMDCRLDLFALFGLRPGEAHVIRNAGGVITDDVIRSLAISQRRLGTREVLVLHHTACGMTTFTDDEFRGELERDTGLRPPWAVEAFVDVKEDVRQSVERIRRSPYLTHAEVVRGFVVDVHSHDVDEIS
ncbi:MAG TPA: carbonic anhydrase [Pseudonocardiaceae bacterium]